MYTLFKAIHFVSLCILLGGPIFWFFLWRPVVASTAAQAPTAMTGDARDESLWNRIRWGTCVGAIVFVISGLVDALRAAAQVFPLSEIDLVWMFLTSARFGQLSLAKALLAPLIAWVAFRRSAPNKDVKCGWVDVTRKFVLVVLGIGLLLTISMASHAAARPGVAPLLVDLIHLMAAVTWGGGLIYLSAFPWKDLGHAGQTYAPVLVKLIKRFSSTALLAVVAVGLTGAISSFFHVYGPASMVTTPYGSTLLVKLILFLLVVGAAGLNLMVFIPRLSGRFRLRLLPRFWAMVRIEAVLITALLVVTGHLTTLPPADTPDIVTEHVWHGQAEPHVMDHMSNSKAATESLDGGTSMPDLNAVLSEDEMWTLVQYVRSLRHDP